MRLFVSLFLNFFWPERCRTIFELRCLPTLSFSFSVKFFFIRLGRQSGSFDGRQLKQTHSHRRGFLILKIRVETLRLLSLTLISNLQCSTLTECSDLDTTSSSGRFRRRGGDRRKASYQFLSDCAQYSKGACEQSKARYSNYSLFQNMLRRRNNTLR